MPTDLSSSARSSVSPNAPAPSADFRWPVRVYYEDTDAGGVVFHANYLKFFERARTEWLRALGIGLKTLAHEQGVLFVVRHVEIDYLAPARLDDALSITATIERLGRASMHFLQHACRDDNGETRIIATARVKVVCVDADALRPASIPDSILKKIAIPA
jgi:acyl-CoA thioester hydrolase